MILHLVQDTYYWPFNCCTRGVFFVSSHVSYGVVSDTRHVNVCQVCSTYEVIVLEARTVETSGV